VLKKELRCEIFVHEKNGKVGSQLRILKEVEKPEYVMLRFYKEEIKALANKSLLLWMEEAEEEYKQMIRMCKEIRREEDK